MAGELTMKERMLAGELYLADDAQLIDDYLVAQRITHQINHLAPDESERRQALMRELFTEFGEGSTLRPPLQVEYGYPTTIGARTFANFGLVILDVTHVTIGDDVQIGPNVQILTATHPLGPGPRRDKWESGQPVTIGDNVWLGAGVIVCPGVTIGDDSVIAAGGVVTDDIPAGVLAGGVPARIIREL